MNEQMSAEERIHQYDEYVGENFGSMIFAGGYQALGGIRFRFIKEGTPPTKYADTDYQVILTEGEMRILVQQTFGVRPNRVQSSFSIEDNTSASGSTPSMGDFENMLRTIIREELEQYFAKNPFHEFVRDGFTVTTAEMLPTKTEETKYAKKEEVIVPIGIYLIGEDIPEGKWHISGVPGEETPYLVTGKKLIKGGIVDLGYHGDTPESGVNLILEKGTYLEITYGAAVFSQVTSLF